MLLGSTGLDRRMARVEAERRKEALAVATVHKDDPVTPGHAMAEGAVEHDKKRRRREPDTVDPDAVKGWKKLLRELVRDGLADGEQVTSGEFPRDLQPHEDGVSHRPVHDGCVPYEDRPEDDLASLPMRSTAPAVDPDTGKAYDFLNSVRLVNGPQDIGPGGLFARKMEAHPVGPEDFTPPGAAPSPEDHQFRKPGYPHSGWTRPDFASAGQSHAVSGKMQMEAVRGPGENLPGPGRPVTPDRERTGPQHHAPGFNPSFGPPPDPAGTRRPYLAEEGRARNSPGNSKNPG